jgi:Acetyltransferase (GNAT) family
MIAFTPLARGPFWTLNPPNDGLFLSNMAVDAAYVRQGIGKLLLKVLEGISRARYPGRRVYLHVRLQDTPAVALYRCVLLCRSCLVLIDCLDSTHDTLCQFAKHAMTIARAQFLWI